MDVASHPENPRVPVGHRTAGLAQLKLVETRFEGEVIMLTNAFCCAMVPQGIVDPQAAPPPGTNEPWRLILEVFAACAARRRLAGHVFPFFGLADPGETCLSVYRTQRSPERSRRIWLTLAALKSVVGHIGQRCSGAVQLGAAANRSMRAWGSSV
jgi:hypothetical protein